MSTKSKRLRETELNVSPADESTIVWPEWSDTTLNNEKWALPKNGNDGLFLDVQSVSMPSSLIPHEWIRVKNLKNLTDPLTVFTPSTEVPDLISNNKHILHSEFMRWFISTVINLIYYGRDGLDVSGENTNFVWNGRYQSWQGWMNIYSMNKAGKGTQHWPAINPNGKYIVRLYFMGSWRRIVVDDMIPVNEEKEPLLPRTGNISELWPMLLSKALLKVCSLSWSERREIVDFHPVTCLTGWVSLQINLSHLSPQDKWDLLMKYTKQFEWTSEEPESENYAKDFKTKTNIKDRRLKENFQEVNIQSQAVILFLGLEDMKDLTPEVFPGLSPCPSHFIYVVQSRDIPLDPKDAKPPLARWKLHRWLKWAINEGLIDPTEYFMPIRYLKITSPFVESKHVKTEGFNGQTEEKTSFRQSDRKEQTTARKSGRKNKLQSTPKETRRRKLKEETSIDIGIWSDFNKMEPYIKNLHLFYKLEYFQYTVRISNTSNLKQTSEKSEDVKRGTTKGSKKSSPSVAPVVKKDTFIDTYYWPRKIAVTRNAPLYLFCDSTSSKFFLINFSTLNSTVASIVEKIADPIMDFLVIERHSWFYDIDETEPLASVCTIGSKSIVMELEDGRHLLRLFCRVESCCFITISSDTIFHLGDRLQMYRLMCTEASRIDPIVKRISDSIIEAFEAFGSENYSNTLKMYYKSYMPDTQNMTKKDKAICKKLHVYFVDETVRLIQSIFPVEEVNNILRSLRIFFLNPTIGLEPFDAISVIFKSLRYILDKENLKIQHSTELESRKYSDENSIDYNRAATIVQAFFKMVIIRKYQQIHNSTHSSYKQVYRDLLKVSKLFDYNKRESIAHRLLRNVIKRHERLSEIYPFFKDLQYVIQVQQCKATLTNVKPNQWLPIVRLSVNLRETETTFSAIDLFINLPKYNLRVFNNETGQEMPRVINNVVPTRYQYVKAGYTIFAYGWSEDLKLKEYEWTLSINSEKGEPMFYLLDDQEPLSLGTKIPSLSVEEFSNTYIPNARNSISKWLITIIKSTIVSFRLLTSYDRVEIKFRLVNEDGKVISEAHGKSVVVLPVVCLRRNEIKSVSFDENATEQNNVTNNSAKDNKVNSSENNIFYAEAFVLDNSWPLTESEWNVANEAKAKMASSFLNRKVSSNKSLKSELVGRRKTSKQSTNANQILESPYWVLQVVIDAGSGIQITEDRTKEKEIARMKETWWQENPENLERGRELRRNFLNKYAVEEALKSESKKLLITSSVRSLIKKSRDKEEADPSPSIVQNVEPRTLKPPQFYFQLPPMDLSAYIIKEGEDEIWTKATYDKKTSENQRLTETVNAEEYYKKSTEEMDNLLTNQREKYWNIFKSYKDSFWQRRSRLDEIYEERRFYINESKSVRPPSIKGSKKEKRV